MMVSLWIAHVSNTLFGLYQRPFSADWDKKLDRILKDGRIIHADFYSITFELDDIFYEVWIANRWYCFGFLCSTYTNRLRTEIPRKLQYRPRMKTMIRLWEIISGYITQKHQDYYEDIYCSGNINKT
ncbi:TPA: hypothetical protein H2W01_004801 [Salmonella enterica]|nr:hypothetical protein [Salmonella enterica]